MPEKEEYIFRPDCEGIWRMVSDDSITLAYFLLERGIIIDDDCQFCRIIRYVRCGSRTLRITIELRAWTCAKVRVNINKQYIKSFDYD